MTEERKRKAKTGWNLSRDAIVVVLVIRELLCLASVPGTPQQKVATCCAQSSAGSPGVPSAAQAEISTVP